MTDVLTAVVTGAGTGIGRACAELLGSRGLHVICAGRTSDTLDEAAAASGNAIAVVADVATEAGRATVVAAATGHQVTAFIHAAGADLAKPFVETTADELDYLLDVNIRAPFLLTQRLLPMLTDGAGVVYVGSVSAVRGRDRHAAYGASKAALIGLVSNLAVELGPRVRVNCVSPGATRTGMLRSFIKQSTAGYTPEQLERIGIADASRMPLRRVAEPREVAMSVIHLALDATATTGVDLAVDVGYTAS